MREEDSEKAMSSIDHFGVLKRGKKVGKYLVGHVGSRDKKAKQMACLYAGEDEEVERDKTDDIGERRVISLSEGVWSLKKGLALNTGQTTCSW